MALKRYLFTITFPGVGESPEEAWEEAVEAFSLDPGNYDDFEIDNDFKIDEEE